MGADRTAEALAALESAERGATPGPWHVGPYEDDVSAGNKLVMGSEGSIDAEFIARWRNAAPGLLKVVRAGIALLEDDESQPGGWGPDNTMQEPIRAALAELAEAVLGPEPGQ